MSSVAEAQLKKTGVPQSPPRSPDKACWMILRTTGAKTRIQPTLLSQIIYRVSQEERAKLREGVPYVKLYRYNPKHLYPKLNGYGDNDQRKAWTSCISAFYTPTAASQATPPGRSSDCVQSVRWLVLRRTSSTQRDKTVLHCCYICKCLEP